MQVKPEVRLMPQLFDDFPRCECHFGWDNQSTKVFRENTFNILKLSGGNDQNFIIPDLGKDALKVSNLWLSSSAIVEGIEQFSKCITKLSILSVPKNSIDITIFKNLDFLGLTWDKKIETHVHEIETLESLSIRYYKYKDINKLQCLNKLKELSFSQGSVTNIEGVNPNLESLDLSYLRNYADVETINTLEKLKWLECENIKKATGTVKLNTFKQATFISFVNTSCTLDLKGIDQLQKLEKLWSNGEHINLNWEDIIPLPNLKLVGLYDSEITDDEIKVIAEKTNRKIERLFRAGTKKRPHIQITFED